MNCLRILGQHTQVSGLFEVQIAGGILRPNSIDSAMAGNLYDKAVRAHKCTLQILGQLLLPQLLKCLEGTELKYLIDITQGMIQKTLITGLLRQSLNPVTKSYYKMCFFCGNTYMEMLCISLMFIQAQCMGLLELHRNAFSCHSSISMIDKLCPIGWFGVS